MTEPLVFTAGAARDALIGVSAAWWLFEAVMNVRQWLRAGRSLSRDPTYVLVYVCVAASVIAAQVLGRRGGLLWPGGLVWPVAVGLTLIVACVVLRAWSIITLGRFFQYSIGIQSGHTVVTTGPYRFVRHPSYTGLLIIAAGYGIAGLAVNAPSLAFLFYLIPLLTAGAAFAVLAGVDPLAWFRRAAAPAEAAAA